MTVPNFVIWSIGKVDYAILLHELENVERQFEFRKGVSREADFPTNARYLPNLDLPDNTILTDNLMNIQSLIVVSGKLKGFLEERAIPKVEYLRVDVMDHKGMVASDDYYIVHPLGPIDCLDVVACGAHWGRVAKDSIKSLERLVIDESKIEPDCQLIRLKHYYPVTLARRELAHAISDAGFSAIRWVELKDYPEV